MTIPSVLERISHSVAQRLEARKKLCSELELRTLAEKARVPFDFKKRITCQTTNVIAEVKFASPSQGALGPLDRQNLMSPREVAESYLNNGAAALSVLTEQDHFRGSLKYLAEIRHSQPDAALLMKDIVLEDYQLLEGRVHGADAALLIVALLGEKKTANLLSTCQSLGLTALVEVHDQEELRVAAGLGADLIGVNNRNLKTLEISLETSFQLARVAPKGATLVSESGLNHASELNALKEVGFSTFLIGTSFMKTGQPGQALAGLLLECS